MGEKTRAQSGVQRSSPPGTVPLLAVIAWLEATAVALLLIQAGWCLDLIASGTAIGITRTMLLVLTVALAAACSGVAEWLSQRATARTEKALRKLTIASAFRIGPVRTRGREGQLLSLATHAVEKTAQYRASFIGPMVGAMTTPLLVLLVMGATVDWVTAAWLALLLLIVPLAVGGFRRLVKPIGAGYRRTQAKLTASFLESIQALDTLAYARAGRRAGEMLARTGEEHRRGLMRMLAGNQLLILVVDAAFSLSVVVAAILLAVSRLRDGHISLGEALAIVLLSVLVTGPVDVVGSFFYIGIGGRAAQRQIEEHLAGAPAATATQPSYPRDAAISVDGVTIGWPGAQPVLTDFSMSVSAGERVALVGPSGVGKSTLSAMLQGELPPASGAVVVDGVDVVADPGAVRERLAVVEQRSHLFLGSIAENLRVADPEANQARLWQALELAGMADEVRAMPDGLDQQVGEHGSLLSGGQGQRLAIARASLRDADILILDEPTSQVDLRAEADILQALDRLAAGRTVVMIAHRPGAVLTADRVIEVKR